MKALEKAKLALRAYILANEDKVPADLAEMRLRSKIEEFIDRQQDLDSDFAEILDGVVRNNINSTPSKERFTEEVDLSKPLPCPFCGSESRIREINEPFDDHALYYDIGCVDDECYLSEGTDWCFDTKEEAIKKWNRRK